MPVDEMMKKRRLITMVTLILAFSCPHSFRAEVPVIGFDEFPVIDGSLACVPLIEQLAQKITGCSEVMA